MQLDMHQVFLLIMTMKIGPNEQKTGDLMIHRFKIILMILFIPMILAGIIIVARDPNTPAVIKIMWKKVKKWFKRNILRNKKHSHKK